MSNFIPNLQLKFSRFWTTIKGELRGEKNVVNIVLVEPEPVEVIKMLQEYQQLLTQQPDPEQARRMLKILSFTIASAGPPPPLPPGPEDFGAGSTTGSLFLE